MDQLVPASGYRHEAVLYSGTADFLAATLDFIDDGLSAGDAIMVIIDEDKIDALHSELGPATPVVFADMADVGANPARLIHFLHAFAAEHAATTGLRGIGEPVYASRSPDVLAECQLLEDLLNIAFPQTRDFWLMCPYDLDSLPDAVIAEAFRTHPYIASRSDRGSSALYQPPEGRNLFDTPLAPIPSWATSVGFGAQDLGELREFVSRRAAALRFLPVQVDEIKLAVNELATNAIVHGGGNGVAHFWYADDVFFFEVTDSGRFDDPLAGRLPPPDYSATGRGLWMANQVCNLIQIRSFGTGTVVRGQVRRIGSS